MRSTEQFDQSSSTKKVIPPRERFQGYQRSGMMLFNNIMSQDTNAHNNNQNFMGQTFNQVIPDSSAKIFKSSFLNTPVPKNLNMSKIASLDRTVRFSEKTKERFLSNSSGP
jgi:hypothetical protein